VIYSLDFDCKLLMVGQSERQRECADDIHSFLMHVLRLVWEWMKGCKIVWVSIESCSLNFSFAKHSALKSWRGGDDKNKQMSMMMMMMSDL